MDFYHKKLRFSFYFLISLLFTSVKESSLVVIKCLLLSVKSDVIVINKVTDEPSLPGTFPVLALEVLSPEKPLCPKQPRETIESVVLDNRYVQPAYKLLLPLRSL